MNWNGRVPTNPYGIKGNWGCKPSKKFSGKPSLKALTYGNYIDTDVVQLVLPADYQEESSCDAYTTGILIEAGNRKKSGKDVIPPHFQFDSRRLYFSARRKFYGDEDPDGGLEIDMGLKAAISEKVIPPDTKILEIEPNPASIAEALFLYGPVLVGSAVGASFMYSCDPDTGEIPLERLDAQDSILGGHAYAIIGVQKVDGRDWYRVANHWKNWGTRDSQASMQHETFMELWYPFGAKPLVMKMGPLWTSWKCPQEWFIKK